MSNSSLVAYTRLSPNKTSPRNKTIDTITIHCVAGNLSIETIGSVFAPESRQASSNYGVGTDGRIGMYVEEKDRSWCTSSGANDHRAITIEVSNNGGANTGWSVSDKALASLIKLVADICTRNSIKKLIWKADKSLIGQVDKQNLTVHRWFANKACPGDYLYEKHSYIVTEVNKILSGGSSSFVTDTSSETDALANYPVLRKGNSGAFVKILQTRLNVHGAALTVDSSFGDLTLTAVKAFQTKKNLLSDGVVGSLTWAALLADPVSSSLPYKIKITAKSLNVRKGPGTGYAVTKTLTNDPNIYTITEESVGTGATLWGKLKSGIGWISLDYTKKV
jgi:hypothetical protein